MSCLVYLFGAFFTLMALDSFGHLFDGFPYVLAILGIAYVIWERRTIALALTTVIVVSGLFSFLIMAGHEQRQQLALYASVVEDMSYNKDTIDITDLNYERDHIYELAVVKNYAIDKSNDKIMLRRNIQD